MCQKRARQPVYQRYLDIHPLPLSPGRQGKYLLCSAEKPWLPTLRCYPQPCSFSEQVRLIGRQTSACRLDQSFFYDFSISLGCLKKGFERLQLRVREITFSPSLGLLIASARSRRYQRVINLNSNFFLVILLTLICYHQTVWVKCVWVGNIACAQKNLSRSSLLRTG